MSPVASRIRARPGRWRWAAVLVWCAVIFAFSAQPNLSTGLRQDFAIRKCAHAAEYAVLALLVRGALATTWARLREPTLSVAAWLAAVAYACTDEFHQTFVRGRHGAPRDVAIDAGGALLGLVVAGAVRRRRSRGAQPRSPDSASVL